MNSRLAEIVREYSLTPEDDCINLFHTGMGHQEEYDYAIADRNDYAVMVARTILAARGCRATRDRTMPA